MPGSRAAATILAAAIVACSPPAVAPSPSPSAPLPTVEPTPTLTPATPEPTPTARPGVQVHAVEIPPSFRYVGTAAALSADHVHASIWAVDLTGRSAARLVAEWDGPGAEFSASRDGRAIAVEGVSPSGAAAIYLLRMPDRSATVVFEEAGVRPVAPQISPDGARIAFGKRPATGIGNDLGVFAGAVGGPYTRIAEPSGLSNVPATPLGWSPDGSWLAFSRRTDRPEIRLVTGGGGPEVAVGDGVAVSWRAVRPELLVGSVARMYTFDLSTRQTRDVHGDALGPFGDVQWHPALERFVHTSPSGELIGQQVWIRDADGSAPARIDGGNSVSEPRWSADGTILSALVDGDDSVVPVIDLLSGRAISVVCRRGGTPPDRCV